MKIERPTPPAASRCVTRASPASLPFVLSLARRFSNQLGFLPTQAVEEYIAAGRVTIATDNGEPAGFLLGPRRLASLPHVRPLVQTAISFDAQRRSLGLALVDAAAAEARRDGQELLQAWCRTDLPANGFWLAAGFLPVALRSTANRRGHPLLLWRRPLNGELSPSAIALPARAGWRTANVSAARFLSPGEVTHICGQVSHGDCSSIAA